MSFASYDVETRNRTLAELREWCALGFVRALDDGLPWPRPFGRALRTMYENMEVRLHDDLLLTPFEPMEHSRTRESHDVWSATSAVFDVNHNGGLRLNPALAEAKKQSHPQHAEFIDALVEDLRPRLPHFGGYTHSNPDIRRVVSEGFDVMEQELLDKLDEVKHQGEPDPGTLNLLLALTDYTAGVHAFYEKTRAALNHAAETETGECAGHLKQIAEAFAGCFLKPSTTFLEGLLAVNFTWHLDFCDSIGRVDQALGELFEKDKREGRLDIDLARRLLDEFFQAFERLNGWNWQIGGYTPDGRDGTNELTLECIAACKRNKLRRPNVAFRITRDTPRKAVLAALDALAEGSGRPALYNDDLYVQTLYGMDLGLSREDSREIGFGGCTETMIAGLGNCGSLEAQLNLAKCLELALNDGRDPITGEQAGPHTGAFKGFGTFEAMMAAVKDQVAWTTDKFVAWANEQLRRRFTEGDPKLYRTFLTRDCVARGKSFEAGGARYNWSVVSYQGIANLIDSLSSIKRCVYDDKSVTHEQLLDALRDDWAGHDQVLQKVKQAPRFGNDDAAADDIATEIIHYAWDRLYRHETPRGGRYLASCILFVTYLGAGRQVGATPDGRRAREALTDSVGSAQGRDTHGPTALLHSVTKLPLQLAVGTPVLNLRFQKQVMAGPQGLGAVADLLRGYFDMGGLQAQVSVLSKQAMLDAKQHPDRHADLIVRVGGYSEYFNKLDPELQDTVIARTEYAL